MNTNNFVNVKIDILDDNSIKLTISVTEKNIFDVVFNNKDLFNLISIFNCSLDEIIKEKKYDVLNYRMNDNSLKEEIANSERINELLKDINENKDFKLLLLNIKLNYYNCIVPNNWLKYIESKVHTNYQEIGPFGSPDGWDYLPWSDITDNIAKSTECWYDVACHYAGMGHFYVMSLLKKEEKCFFRMSGGANGYDRLANMQMFKNHNPYLQQDKLFDLQQGIELLTDTSYESYKVLQEGDNSKIKLN